jgi:hypothetical protein
MTYRMGASEQLSGRRVLPSGTAIQRQLLPWFAGRLNPWREYGSKRVLLNGLFVDQGDLAVFAGYAR